MRYAVPPPATTCLPVRDSDEQFPIHRIYCVGRNYAAHAIEMGHDPDREEPFFFQKNPDTLVLGLGVFRIPYSDVCRSYRLFVLGGHRYLGAEHSCRLGLGYC